jgi:hypothetical protein
VCHRLVLQRSHPGHLLDRGLRAVVVSGTPCNGPRSVLRHQRPR